MTHTLAELAISKAAHEEIAKLLLDAGYDHCVIATKDGVMLDMTGIGLVAAKVGPITRDTPLNAEVFERALDLPQDYTALDNGACIGAPLQQKQFKIIINGVGYCVVKNNAPFQKISYDELCKLVGLKGSPSCTWRRQFASGILWPDKDVDICDGMIFNIVHTGNA